MRSAFLKSCASALSNVASVRAPLTIAKANTWLSFDRHCLSARRRSSSCRSLSASADLSLPARYRTARSRRTSSSLTSSSMSGPAATRRGFPFSPRSQFLRGPGLARNCLAAFVSTIRHTVRHPGDHVLLSRRTGGSPRVDSRCRQSCQDRGYKSSLHVSVARSKGKRRLRDEAFHDAFPCEPGQRGSRCESR